ncbi:MAG: hypothetical protein LCI00_24805 [Chloroflexi bacterium]|nr:hypothetical protein [Chloroflexota bacterium]MCC6895793.1 hypothetical protein [Anaerolineae bacterium]
MEGTPDTVAYLYLGLAVVAIIGFGFIGSIVVRFRNLQQDLRVIEQLRED